MESSIAACMGSPNTSWGSNLTRGPETIGSCDLGPVVLSVEFTAV
jgi:hypothetical protein